MAAWILRGFGSILLLSLLLLARYVVEVVVNVGANFIKNLPLLFIIGIYTFLSLNVSCQRRHGWRVARVVQF